MIVRQDIRIGDEEEEREESGERAPELARPSENHIPQEERDQNNRETRHKGDQVRIVSHAEEESVPEFPLRESPVSDRSFGVLALIDVLIASLPEDARDGEGELGECKEGESREILDERRMLGIDSHIEVFHVAVGRRDMRLLIHRGRIVPGELHRKRDKRNEECRDEPRSVFFEEFHNNSK